MPISLQSCLIATNLGSDRLAIVLEVKPITETCSGTDLFNFFKALIATVPEILSAVTTPSISGLFLKKLISCSSTSSIFQELSYALHLIHNLMLSWHS